MKLTDLVSPQEFSELLNSVDGFPKEEKQSSMNDVMPYYEFLTEQGVFHDKSIAEISVFMTALSAFQQCLNRKTGVIQ